MRLQRPYAAALAIVAGAIALIILAILSAPKLAPPAPTPEVACLGSPAPEASGAGDGGQPPAAEPYGPGVNADTLANTQVGGTNESQDARTSYRFRAGHTGDLASVRIYMEDGDGYSGGDGGELEVTLQADDGSDAHLPSGEVLSSLTFRPGNPIEDRFRSLVFDHPAPLRSGQLYHVVFRNTAPDPGHDFVSVNALFMYGEPITPRQPAISDLDWAQLLDAGSGWTVRPRNTPIMALTYADGVNEGMGYMEVWTSTAEIVSGDEQVREVVTVNCVDRTVGSVSIRLARAAGSSPLTIRLETAEGETLDQTSVPAADVGEEQTWVSASFSAPHRLLAGRTYHLVLTAPDDTAYSAVGIRKGIAYDFPPITYFYEGHAEIFTGGSWIGFRKPANEGNSNQADLQFFFR